MYQYFEYIRMLNNSTCAKIHLHQCNMSWRNYMSNKQMVIFSNGYVRHYFFWHKSFTCIESSINDIYIQSIRHVLSKVIVVYNFDVSIFVWINNMSIMHTILGAASSARISDLFILKYFYHTLPAQKMLFVRRTFKNFLEVAYKFNCKCKMA